MVRRSTPRLAPSCRAALFAAPLVFAASLLLVAALPAGSLEPAPFPETRLDGFYREHPELTSQRGTGYKPYQRLRWFASSRQAPAGVSTGRLRAEAFHEGQRRLAATRDGARGAQPAWFSTGPHTLSGRVTALTIPPSNPSIVYAGTAGGGLWKTTDAGETWAPCTDGEASLGVGAALVLPWDEDVVLVGTGDGNFAGFAGMGIDPFGVGILRSTDAGATWGATSLQYPEWGSSGFNAMAANPASGTVLAAANDGLWRSTDDGVTWNRTVTTGNIMDVVWKPGDAARVYITKCNDPFVTSVPDAGVHVSTNDGVSFTRVGAGQPAAAFIGQTRLAVTAANPSVVYANYANNATFASLGLYRSTDDGATWQVRNNTTNVAGQQGWFNLTLAVDPNNAETIITGGLNFYRSVNGGTDLERVDGSVQGGTELSPHVDHHALIYEPGSTSNLWLGCDGGVWRSTNDGAGWRSRREGIVSFQFYDVCVAQGPGFFMMGGAQDNGTPGRSGLASWSETTLGGDGSVCNISSTNPNIVYGQQQGSSHFKSFNAGGTWQAINAGLPPNGPFIAAQDQSPLVGNHLYTAANGGIYRTTNGGNLWVNVGTQFANSIAFSEADGNTIWTTSGFSGTWITTNDGASWTLCNSFPLTGFEVQVRTHPTDAGTAFVTSGGYSTGVAKVVRSTDHGASWSDVSGNLPDVPVNAFAVDPGDGDSWFAGTDVGVWRSTDAGSNWAPFGTDLPNVVVTDVEIRSDGADPPARKLVAGTFGRGVWEVDLPTLVPVGVPQVAGLATGGPLMLDAPYPNPVRQEAILRWAARSTAPVRLEIVDVAGRRVATVVDAGRGDGLVRTASWIPDGTPSGVYYAILRAGDATKSRKIVVAR